MDQGLPDRIDHEDGVDGLPGALHHPDMVQHFGDGPGRWDADELRRHDAAGAALGISQQARDGGPDFRAEAVQQRRSERLLEDPENIGGAVG